MASSNLLLQRLNHSRTPQRIIDSRDRRPSAGSFHDYDNFEDQDDERRLLHW
ncbi:hypothetical protein FRC00_014564, partial [Tulasnella sp. 408]